MKSGSEITILKKILLTIFLIILLGLLKCNKVGDIIMNHVVVNVHPFIMRQEVAVYKNGECVEHVETNFENLDKVCYELCKKHNIHQLDYAGNKEYGLKLEEKLNFYEYDSFPIQFNYY